MAIANLVAIVYGEDVTRTTYRVVDRIKERFGVEANPKTVARRLRELRAAHRAIVQSTDGLREYYHDAGMRWSEKSVAFIVIALVAIMAIVALW